MALIKIPKKAASSNKTDLTPKTGQPGTTDETTYPKTPKPFIDKLAINLTFQSYKQAVEVHTATYAALTDADSEVFTSTGKPLKGFKLAKQIVMEAWTSDPRIDYDFVTNPQTGERRAHRVRLELDPSRLGPTGFQYLHDVLGGLMKGGWRLFIEHGRISRLDVAVDLVDVRITKLKIAPPKAVVSQTWSGSKGKLETYQWGKPKGSHTAIYNKTAEMVKRGEPVSGPQITRFERRMKPPSCKSLLKLAELGNPFAGFILTTAIPDPPDEGPGYVWPLFCDSVSVRGLHAALQLLKPEKRSAYKKQFAKVAPDWWNPDAIWAQWPAVLQESKIATPEAY